MTAISQLFTYLKATLGWFNLITIKKNLEQVAQLLTVLFLHAKVAGLIPGHGIYRNHPMNA